MNEKKMAKIRKNNMKLHPIYEMIGLDYLFYYGIEVLFLAQIKGFSNSQIILMSSVYAIFAILFQIPSVAFVNKLGKRKCAILGNISKCLSILIIIFCNSYIQLILAYLVRAIGGSLKGVTDSPLLSSSIPITKQKGQIFSKIDGKGYARYCYMGCIAKVLSGPLYTVNPYLPVWICFAITVFTVIISYNYIDIEELEESKEKIDMKENVKEIKEGFSYIFHSKRLRALILMLGVLWGLINLLENYAPTLMKDLAIPATVISLTAAIAQLITGFCASKANWYNGRFKNKSLKMMGMGLTIGAIIIGVCTVLKIPFYIQIVIMVTAFLIRAGIKGFYQVIKKRYMGNFAEEKILPKIYASYSIIANLFRAGISFVGSMLLAVMDARFATLAIGCIFIGVIILISHYMQGKVGVVQKAEQ